MHETAQLEGWPVGDFNGFDGSTTLIAFGQLLKGLSGTDHACRRNGFNGDGRLGDIQPIGLVLIAVQPIVIAAGNLIDQFDFHTLLPTTT